jgi:hypothetical protein
MPINMKNRLDIIIGKGSAKAIDNKGPDIQLSPA